MMDENAPDLVTLEDEDGNQFTFEIVDETEYNDRHYIAVVPYAANEQEAAAALEEEADLIIMRTGEEDGETFFDAVDDDEEYYNISAVFAKRLEELYDIESEDLPRS